MTGRTADSAEWTTEDVLRHLEHKGRGIRPSTWYAYVSRGQAPAPSRHVGRTPVWAPADIKAFAKGTWRPTRERS